MAYSTATGSAITEMCKLIIRYKKGLYTEDVEEESRMKAKKLSDVTIALQSIFDKLGVEKIDKFLKNIFETT